MAFTYLRKDSPWVWVCYLDAAGKRQRKPSDIPVNLPDTNRRRKTLKAEYDLQEGSLPRTRREGDRWVNWVPTYLESRYRDSPKSLSAMKGRWTPLAAYLEHMNIKTARGLTYTVAAGYVDWRLGPTGLRKVIRNTAILESRLLSVPDGRGRPPVPGPHQPLPGTGIAQGTRQGKTTNHH